MLCAALLFGLIHNAGNRGRVPLGTVVPDRVSEAGSRKRYEQLWPAKRCGTNSRLLWTARPADFTFVVYGEPRHTIPTLTGSPDRTSGCRPLLAVAGFQWPRGNVGRRREPRSRSRGRRGSCNASGLRAQSEPLQRGSIELAGRIQPMRGLKPTHGGSGIIIPFAAW